MGQRQGNRAVSGIRGSVGETGQHWSSGDNLPQFQFLIWRIKVCVSFFDGLFPASLNDFFPAIYCFFKDDRIRRYHFGASVVFFTCSSMASDLNEGSKYPYPRIQTCQLGTSMNFAKFTCSSDFLLQYEL